MYFKLGKSYEPITPISVGVDLLVINILAHTLPINFKVPLLFHSYISLAWIILSFKNSYYDIFPYTKVIFILKKLVTQFVFFFLILYAYIGFFKEPIISRLALAQYFIYTFLVVAALKFLLYFLFLEYRERLKERSTRVVVVGDNQKTRQLIELFQNKTEYGYQFMRQFFPDETDFDLEKCFNYILGHEIDEIYCSISELKNREIAAFVGFADNNLKSLKFLPDNKNIYSKKLRFEYYDYLPILSLRDIPLHNPINAFIKRTFDVVFSLIVIFGLLIWIGPIIALLITIESRGPVFFMQKRTGLDNREFYCFKFRSMAMNRDSDQVQAVKNDMRVTALGRFIRKTSIDELPQFYNVLFGHMSVVGPRPHMVKHTDEYAMKVDKYMVRHFVKPGITGLAQVKGYRGEVEEDRDIQNRIKFDIFYIENWSFLLDLKIIIQTVLNMFKGEEKAY